MSDDPFAYKAESSDAASDGVCALLRCLRITLDRDEFDESRFDVRIEVEEVADADS